MRVHPEILARQQLPPSARKGDIWKRRFREVNDWERYLIGPGLPHRQDLPEPLEGGAAAALPGPHRRARQELEVQRRRRPRAALLGRLPEGLQRGAQPTPAPSGRPGTSSPPTTSRSRGWPRPASSPTPSSAIDPQYPTVSQEAREALLAAKAGARGEAPRRGHRPRRGRRRTTTTREQRKRKKGKGGRRLAGRRQRRRGEGTWQRQPAPRSGRRPRQRGTAWHALSAEEALAQQKVDAASGLSAAEVASRRSTYGPNKLAEAAKEPRWQAFLRQYRDPMQIVLLVAGVVCLFLPGQFWTGVVLIVLTLFNAFLGLNQEGKAEASVAALQKMMVVKARSCATARSSQVPMEDLVPGDIVMVEAGDLVPADGRLVRAATLEIDESALTGESAPVPKQVEAVAADAAARRPRRHGLHEHAGHARRRHAPRDLHGHGHRGRPHLRHAPGPAAEETPLTKQLNALTNQILVIAGVVAHHLHRARALARPALRRALPDGRRLRRLGHPHRPARPSSRPSSPRAPRRSPRPAPSSSACARWRRWAPPRPSTPTRRAP